METNDYKMEEIVSYLSGELEESEAQAFEARMEADPQFEEYVREVLRAKAASYLLGRTAWKDRMREQFGRTKRFPFFLMAAAVALILLLGAMWWYSKQPTLSPVEQFAQQHVFVPAPEMRGASLDSLINLAYVSYNEQNFEGAIARFDELLVDPNLEHEDDILFFKAMALIELGNYVEAAAVLKLVKDGSYTSDAEEVRKKLMEIDKQE